MQYYLHLFRLCVCLVVLTLHASLLWAGDFSRGLLWEVRMAGQPASYLLGTIHSDDPRVTSLPDPVAQAFTNAKSFTAEMDMSLSAMLSASQALLFADGQTLESVAGQARYRKAVQLMADYGMPEMIVNQMKPWAVAVQLNLPRPGSGMFLDLMLYQQAHNRAIDVHALETVSEQLSVFDEMPMPGQLTMLDEAIANYHTMPAMIERLIELYLQRDLAGLQRYNDQQMQHSDRSLAEHIEQKMIVERNLRMVRRMQPRLAEGEAFIAVGALHLPGKHGILNLLQAQGYRVKALY